MQVPNRLGLGSPSVTKPGPGPPITSNSGVTSQWFDSGVTLLLRSSKRFLTILSGRSAWPRLKDHVVEPVQDDVPAGTMRRAAPTALPPRAVVALFRAPDAQHFERASHVLRDAGVTCQEYTLTTDGALDALVRTRKTLGISCSASAPYGPSRSARGG